MIRIIDKLNKDQRNLIFEILKLIELSVEDINVYLVNKLQKYIKKGKLYNNVQYDYVCCSYPEGMGDKAVLLKKDDIEKIKFVGFQDNRFVELKKSLGVES